jgi:hypothetical protein
LGIGLLLFYAGLFATLAQIMKHYFEFILILCCLLTGIRLDAQNEAFKPELLEKAQDFDSVILVRHYSYWGPDIHLFMEGFGIKGDSCFWLMIFLKDDNKERNMFLKSFSKYPVIEKDRADSIRAFHFSAVEALSADSINKSQQASGTDGENYHLYLLKPGKYLTKSFYSADDFPSYAALSEIRNKLYLLLRHSK